LAQSAIALRLLGDRQVTPALSLVLEEEKSLAPRIAVTAALGQVGDRRAVDPLCRALNDLDRADHARAYAAMALGQVADRNRRPWQASLSRGFNHLALASALSNGDGTGLLEMP
ncbi:MAG: HEAT repeat domain-containing protein, partial [Planctomycetota bacterium]